MRQKEYYFWIFLLSSCIITALAQLGPEDEANPDPAPTSGYERKSAKGLEEENREKSTVQDADTEDIEKYKKFIGEEFSMSSGSIKIINAPDLSNGNDKKVTDTLNAMMEYHEKWIQKIENELEEIEKAERESANEEPVKEKTADEIEGNFSSSYLTHL